MLILGRRETSRWTRIGADVAASVPKKRVFHGAYDRDQIAGAGHGPAHVGNNCW